MFYTGYFQIFVFPKRKYPLGGRAKQNSGAFSTWQPGEVPFSRDCTGKKGNWSQAGDRGWEGDNSLLSLRKPAVWEKDLWNQTRKETSKMPHRSSLLCKHEKDRNSTFVMYWLSMVKTVKINTEHSFHYLCKTTIQLFADSIGIISEIRSYIEQGFCSGIRSSAKLRVANNAYNLEELDFVLLLPAMRNKGSEQS